MDLNHCVRIVLFALIGFSADALSQTLDTVWIRKFDARGLDDRATMIRATRNGTMVVPASVSLGFSVAEAVVLKLDTAGNLVRSRLFHKYDDDLAGSIVETADGGYLLTGTTSHEKDNPCQTPNWKIGNSYSVSIASECAGVAGENIYTGYAIRLDSLMDTLWTRRYDVRNVSVGLELSNGGFLALTYRGNSGGNNDTVAIAGLGADGAVVWEKPIGDVNVNMTHWIANKSGGFVLAGINRTSKNSWIASFDSTGTPLWNHAQLGGGATWSLWIDTAGMVYQVVDQVANQSTTSLGELRGFSTSGASTVLGNVPRLGGAPAGFHGFTPDGSWLLLSGAGNVLHAGIQPSGAGAMRTSSWSGISGVAGVVEIPRGSGVYYVAGNTPNQPISNGNDITLVKLALNGPPSFVGPSTDLRIVDEGVAVVSDTLRVIDGFSGDSVRVSYIGPTASTFTFTAATGVFSWAPAPDYFGDTSFTFVATDRVGQADTLTYRIRVTNVNDAPTFSVWFPEGIPRFAANFGDTVRGALKGIDRDGDVLRYRNRIPKRDFTVDSVTGEFKWIPSGSTRGPFQVEFEVSDGSIAYRRKYGFLTARGPFYEEHEYAEYDGPGRDTLTFGIGVQFILNGMGGPTTNWDFSVGSVVWDDGLVFKPGVFWNFVGSPDSLPDFQVEVIWGGFGSPDSVVYFPNDGLRSEMPSEAAGFSRKFMARRMGGYGAFSGLTGTTPVTQVVHPVPRIGIHLTRNFINGDWELIFPGKIPESYQLTLVDATGRSQPVHGTVIGPSRIRIQASGLESDRNVHHFLRVSSTAGISTFKLHR